MTGPISGPISARIIALPLRDGMTPDAVATVCRVLLETGRPVPGATGPAPIGFHGRRRRDTVVDPQPR